MALCLILFFGLAQAASVTLTWDPNVEPDLAGYRMYRGGQAGGPYDLISQGLIQTTNYMDSTLAPGAEYHYVCTAVNEAGLESGYSNEVAYQWVCRGDANGDGVRTISDAVLITRYLVGLDPLEGYGLLAADADGSGSVTISDVVRIQQHLVGLNILPECK